MVSKDVDYIYNMACNMGGMGFIENNKAECMLSVLINTNLLRACIKNNVDRYFFSSSACVYNAQKQKNTLIHAFVISGSIFFINSFKIKTDF